MNEFIKKKIKHSTNPQNSHQIQSKKKIVSPSVSQNSDNGKSKSKKRKKRKSVIYKPHKSPKKLKSVQSPKLSFQLDSTNKSFVSRSISLNPSISETTDIGDSSTNDIDQMSDISLSLNNRKFHRTKSDSSFNIACKRSSTTNDSDLKDVLNEFLQDSTVKKNSSYTGDISELMCGGLDFEKEENNTNEHSINDSDLDKNGECSDEMNDSVDLRINSLLQNKEIDDNTDSENSELDYELFTINSDDYVVVLKYSQTIKIFGYCNVKVLFGRVNILGYTLTGKSPEYTVYSPRGSALLALCNTSVFCDELVKVKNILPQFQNEPSLKDLVMRKVRKDNCVIMFLKKSDFTLNLIEDHVSQWIFPEKTIYPCVEVVQKSWNMISKSEEWDKIISTITSNYKLFICGGKGVGKSTFLRYAINCLLQKYKKIRVIDLDPGQSEFTVPGTLSIVTVTEPLLGVNYTHLKEADRSILCDINVSQDPLKYVQRIEELMKFSKSQECNNIPTLINYMGYTNDIAFHLVSSTIVILQPEKIVYIHSSNKKKNYKIPLNQKNIVAHSKLFCPNLSIDFEIEVNRIPSLTDDNIGWTLEPRQMREMCILAYFGKSLGKSAKSLQDYSLEMFEVNLLEITVTDKENVNVSADSINGNIVALCVLVNEELCLFECFGWGIIRCINASKTKATVITPMDEVMLKKVTHFVVGCLTLPPSIYMNTEYVHDEIPYIIEGELLNFGQMSKRTHMPSTTSRK